MDTPEQSIWMKPARLAFATSVLALMERSMLTQTRVDQLKNSGNPKELMRMLSDTPYAPYFDQNINVDDMVEAETLRTKEELYEILPSSIHWFFDAYYRRYDYNNLKMVLKSYFQGNPSPLQDMSLAGTLSPVELISYIEEDRFDELPFPVNVEALRNEAESSGGLRIVDAELDKAYYGEFTAAAERLGDPFFLGYIREQVDLKNILIFIRASRTGVPLERYLLPGGHIPLADFVSRIGEGYDTLLTDTRLVGYRPLLQEGLAALERTGSYAHLETSIRNYSMEVLDAARDVTFTIKPFIAFLFAKEHEISLVKKIFIHINNYIPFGTEKDIVYV